MARLILASLRLYFRLRMTVRPIAPGDKAVVGKLLADQFAHREPLTRQLGLSSNELLPLIIAHIDYCAQGKLGVVAHSHDGTLLGVITAEDDYRPFIPPEELLTPRLRMVGDVLGRVALPNTWAPESERDLFYCDLAATDPRHADKHVLAALTLGIFDHLSALGYRRGYAKVTNARMMARLRGFERLLWRPIFTELCRYRNTEGSEVIAVGWSLDFWHSRTAKFVEAAIQRMTQWGRDRLGNITFSLRVRQRASFITVGEKKR